MSESIEITDVRVTEMSADQMTPVMAQSGVIWYRLTLTVQNRSVKPIYVVSDIRRIHYDLSRRVLVMQFSEHEAPNESPMFRLPIPPRYQVIGTSEEVTIVHSLSSPITFLETSADGTWRSKYVRLSEDVDLIECTVAYETEPPIPVIDLTDRTMPDHWRDCQTTVTASWRASPSKKERKKTSD